MDAHATLTRAAELAHTAHKLLADLVYDLPAWTAVEQAGKIATLVDAAGNLRAGAELARHIAAAIAPTAEPATAAICAHCGAPVTEPHAHRCARPRIEI